MSADVETKPVEEIKTVEEETKKMESPEKKKDGGEEKGEKIKDEKEPEGKKEAAPPAPPPPRVHKVDFDKDVVYLYQFCRTPVLPSLSPYSLKVESFLRLYDIKYEVCQLDLLKHYGFK